MNVELKIATFGITTNTSLSATLLVDYPTLGANNNIGY